MNKRIPLIAYAIERLFVAIKKKFNQIDAPLCGCWFLENDGKRVKGILHRYLHIALSDGGA